MESSHEMDRIDRLVHGLIVCLTVLLLAVAARASEGEHRIGEGVSYAVGVGAELAHGDYGSNADATAVTLPVLVAVNPLEAVDLTFELPMVFLSSRSGSGVVVTQSGGIGLRRGASSSTVTTTTTTTTVTEAGLGDISLTAGWTLVADSEVRPKIRPTLFLKAPTGNKDQGLGTGTFEAGPGLSLSKWLGDLQFFADGSYIFQNSTSSYAGKNYVSYSAGGGFQATDRLFVSLYAKGSSARVSAGTASLEGYVKFNYLQSRRVSWELYGLTGFSDASPDAGGGLLVMYQF